jgi:hypothetical protein
MPTDDVFPEFLAGLRPRRFCVACLAAICGTDIGTIRRRLDALGQAVEVVSGTCANCEGHVATYRLRGSR